jgi:dipeptidase E
LIKEKESKKEIENKILSSDIIYVGGGDTLKMMTLWRRYGVDKILKQVVSIMQKLDKKLDEKSMLQ